MVFGWFFAGLINRGLKGSFIVFYQEDLVLLYIQGQIFFIFLENDQIENLF